MLITLSCATMPEKLTTTKSVNLHPQNKIRVQHSLIWLHLCIRESMLFIQPSQALYSYLEIFLLSNETIESRLKKNKNTKTTQHLILCRFAFQQQYYLMLRRQWWGYMYPLWIITQRN